jgi:sec-independent protein translocase protein TatA
MFDFSPVQIIIVLVIALLIFGPKRLPEMGRNLGKGLRDFKGGLTGEHEAQSGSSDASEVGRR